MRLKILIGMCSALVLLMVLWHPKDMDTKDLVISIPKGETTVGVFREQNSGTGMQDRPSGRSVGYSGETITRTAEVRSSGVPTGIPDETDAEGAVSSDEGYSGYDASTSEGEGVPDEADGVDGEPDEGYEESFDYYSELPVSGDTDMGDGERTDDTAECDSGVDESGYAESEYDSDSTEPVTEEEDTTIAEEDATFEEEDATSEPEDTTSELTYLGEYTISFYCPCPICCGDYATGYTASGTLATEGRTVASGQFDFGTQLYIDGFGYYVVEDRGVEGNWIDVFCADHQTCLDLGLQNRIVYLVG